MKIQSINNNIYLNYTGNKTPKEKSKPTCPNIELQQATIPNNISIFNKKEDDFFELFLNKKGKVTKEEYDEIVKKHPSAIVKAYRLTEENQLTSSSPRQTALAAVKLKERYDKEYKGKYTIVSIGTSPSPITETMSALGCKVIFLPASGLNGLYSETMFSSKRSQSTIASKVPNVRYIMDYAKRKGINSDNKDFILLLDYCCSGNSLERMLEIFEEEKVIPEENIHERSILGDLIEETNAKKPKSGFYLEDFANIAHDMQNSYFEDVSNVPHFHVFNWHNEGQENHISSSDKTEDELFQEFENYSQPNARAYALCCINEAMKLL